VYFSPPPPLSGPRQHPIPASGVVLGAGSTNFPFLSSLEVSENCLSNKLRRIPGSPQEISTCPGPPRFFLFIGRRPSVRSSPVDRHSRGIHSEGIDEIAFGLLETYVSLSLRTRPPRLLEGGFLDFHEWFSSRSEMTPEFAFLIRPQGSPLPFFPLDPDTILSAHLNKFFGFLGGGVFFFFVPPPHFHGVSAFYEEE